MPRNTELELNTACAVVCVGWLREEGLEVGPVLRAKLNVPSGRLLPVLKSLTASELLDLKNGILKAAMKGPMPGPLRVDELMVILDSLGNHQAKPSKEPARMRPD